MSLTYLPCLMFNLIGRFEDGKVEGRKEGMEIGLEIGVERGVKKGKKEEKITIAQNLKKMGLDTQAIIDATGLTQAEVESLP